MKSSTAKNGQPARTLFDVARETGLAEQFRARVETHVKARRRRRRTIKAGAALMMACALLAFWAVPTLRDTTTAATLPAQSQALTLADGSLAELNAQTRLHTDFRFGRRLVNIERGEAFFSVVKDARHPFIVQTPGGTIRVTGTDFNVRLSPHGVEVTLFEGLVRVEDGAAPVQLAPAQQFDSATGRVRTLSATELEAVASWRQGNLIFDGLTLADAATRIGLYHGCTIVVARDVAALEPGGTFPLRDLSALWRALESVLPVQVIAGPDQTYRIVKR